MDGAGGATARKEPHPGELRVASADPGVSFPVTIDGGAGVRADRRLICEASVERSSDGRRHGYVFESQEDASNPEARVPIRAAGRMRHPDPDHGDDSDERTDRVPGFTPTRFQAQDNGAACFAWPANVWGDREVREKLYFECLAGGPLDMRQVWIYDDARATLTLG